VIGKQVTEVPADAGEPVPDPAQSSTVTVTSDDVTQRAVAVSVSLLVPVQSAVMTSPISGLEGVDGIVQVQPALQSAVFTQSAPALSLQFVV